jgi:hypothetical protein
MPVGVWMHVGLCSASWADPRATALHSIHSRRGGPPLDRQGSARSAVRVGRPNHSGPTQVHTSQQVNFPGNGPSDATELWRGAELEAMPHQV